jgi:hypothetical protein
LDRPGMEFGRYLQIGTLGNSPRSIKNIALICSRIGQARCRPVVAGGGNSGGGSKETGCLRFNAVAEFQNFKAVAAFRDGLIARQAVRRAAYSQAFAKNYHLVEYEPPGERAMVPRGRRQIKAPFVALKLVIVAVAMTWLRR